MVTASLVKELREKAVQEGLIDEMGGMKEATDKLIEKINQSKNK